MGWADGQQCLPARRFLQGRVVSNPTPFLASTINTRVMVDRTSVSEVAKKHGVSDQTLYTWRRYFGGLDPSDVKRLRQLERENNRLKKLVVERDLEIEVMKEIAVKMEDLTPSTA